MGGRAISNASPMTTEVYMDVCAQICLKLVGFPHRITHKLASKRTHHDINIVAMSTDPDRVLHCLQPVEVVRNGDNVSVGMPYIHGDSSSRSCRYIFQVDIIFTEDPSAFSHIHAFMSYSCFGECIGKVLKAYDLKYTKAGLKAPVLFSRQHILVSSERDAIFDLLGLDSQRFDRGFSDVCDLLDFVFSSPYAFTEAITECNTNPTSRLFPYIDFLRQHASFRRSKPSLPSSLYEIALQNFKKNGI